MWRPLAPILEEHAVPRALPVTPAPGRRKVERSAASLIAATAEATASVRVAATASLRFTTVTEEAKGTDAEASVVTARAAGERAPAGRGVSWGRAVHRSIEALGRGRTGESLRAFVRAVATDESLDDELSAALLPLVERTASSDAWRSLLAAGGPQVELTVMRRSEQAGVETITEGVVDAAAQGPDGWRIVDWKSDDVDDAGWAARREKYERQVEAYVQMLAALTGQGAEGAVVRVASNGGAVAADLRLGVTPTP
jgi:ATP-dependent exoDNAse (exonuclease V) beta subunit